MDALRDSERLAVQSRQPPPQQPEAPQPADEALAPVSKQQAAHTPHQEP